MAFLASIKGFKTKKKKLRSTTTRVTTTSGRVKTERRDASTGAVLEVEAGAAVYWGCLCMRRTQLCVQHVYSVVSHAFATFILSYMYNRIIC